MITWRTWTFWRRCIQAVSLILLVYGGYLFKDANLEDKASKILPKLKAPDGSISTTQFKKGNILWPSGATPVLEIFPPSLICRFNPNGGMFKACFLHFLSENLTWRTSLKYLLPYISLFVLLCFVFGRMWCGWVCPVGTVGDALTWLRRKMNVPARRFPVSFRHSLQYSSYGLAGLSLAISAVIGMPNYTRFQCYWFLPYCQVCPARLICPLFGLINPSWKDFSTLVTTSFTLLAWLFLGLFVAAFYWGRRVWCHLCPVGMLNALFNKGCGVELKKSALRCNHCAACAESCPMGLTRMYEQEHDGLYNQHGCILCFRCVEACPQSRCLTINFFGKKMGESGYRAAQCRIKSRGERA